jgi:hypothetical protein
MSAENADHSQLRPAKWIAIQGVRISLPHGWWFLAWTARLRVRSKKLKAVESLSVSAKKPKEGIMAGKSVIFGIVILFVFALGFNYATQKRSAELPPGVIAEMWISLTPYSGIALNSKGAPPGTPMMARDGMVVYGTLMVKSQGFWQKVYLEPAPGGRFLPVRYNTVHLRTLM